MPTAKGDAKVNAVTGKTNIDVHFDGLTPANGFGPEYLTYVLWAISADGRPQNLGELELSGGKASLNVTTGYQSFGMIVTRGALLRGLAALRRHRPQERLQ